MNFHQSTNNTSASHQKLFPVNSMVSSRSVAINWLLYNSCFTSCFCGHTLSVACSVLFYQLPSFFASCLHGCILPDTSIAVFCQLPSLLYATSYLCGGGVLPVTSVVTFYQLPLWLYSFTSYLCWCILSVASYLCGCILPLTSVVAFYQLSPWLYSTSYLSCYIFITLSRCWSVFIVFFMLLRVSIYIQLVYYLNCGNWYCSRTVSWCCLLDGSWWPEWHVLVRVQPIKYSFTIVINWDCYGGFKTTFRVCCTWTWIVLSLFSLAK